MNAESPTFTLGSEYNSAGFTFRVAGESAAGIDGRQVYLSLNDGTTNNAVSVYRDTDRTLYLEVTKAGVQQCLLDMGTLADSTAFSLGARIAPDDMAASLGVTEVRGAGEVPTLTTGNIGHELGADQCNSILSEISIEPKQSLWHDGTDLYYGNALLWTDTGDSASADAIAAVWSDGTHTAFYEAPTSDEFGQPTDEWTGWKTLWAAVEPIRGRELYESSQRFGALSTRIVIRYLAGVDETQRIKFGERYFSLVSPPINKDFRNQYLELMCTEGPQDE